MKCQTQCVDILHEWCGHGMKDINKMGDILILLNSLLFIFGYFQNWINYNIIIEFTLIMIFFTCVRASIALVTMCKANSHPTVKAWTTRQNNNLWFMISGHTVGALVITGIIFYSEFPIALKVFSAILSVFVCFFQSATREHYTSDIILTICLVFLAMKSFVRC